MNTTANLKLAVVTAALVVLGLFLTVGLTGSGNGSSYEITGFSFGGSQSNPPGSAGAATPSNQNPVAKPSKEPAYQSEPFYCQLAFGPKREHLVMTAADLKARILHVDLNGNRDWTEAGESFEIKQTGQYQETVYLTSVVPELSVGENIHTNLKIKYGQTGDQVRGVFSVQLWGWSESTTDADLIPLELSSKSETIPLLHFDGPLTMGNYRKIVEMPRGEESKFYSLIGTTGQSGGTLTAIANTEIAEGLNPKVEFEFPHEDPSQPPIKVTAYLPTRC